MQAYFECNFILSVTFADILFTALHSNFINNNNNNSRIYRAQNDTNPLMCLSPRRESPGTDMGQHLKSTRQVECE